MSLRAHGCRPACSFTLHSRRGRGRWMRRYGRPPSHGGTGPCPNSKATSDHEAPCSHRRRNDRAPEGVGRTDRRQARCGPRPVPGLAAQSGDGRTGGLPRRVRPFRLLAAQASAGARAADGGPQLGRPVLLERPRAPGGRGGGERGEHRGHRREAVRRRDVRRRGGPGVLPVRARGARRALRQRRDVRRGPGALRAAGPGRHDRRARQLHHARHVPQHLPGGPPGRQGAPFPDIRGYGRLAGGGAAGGGTEARP